MTFSLNKTPEMTFVKKGWGFERWIVNKPEYCGKLLFFEEGKRCSWHYHKIKQETFYVQKGKLKIWYGFDDDITKAKELIMIPGQKFELPVGLRHQILGLEDTDMFEFSTTHFESDSHRITKGD